MEERRPPIFLITGVIIGFALGILYTWVIIPVEKINTHPITLQNAYKDEYRALVANAYASSGDLGRAQARLDLLGDNDPARVLAVLAQRTLGQEGMQNTARALGLLAAHLSGERPELPGLEVNTPDTQTEETPEPATQESIVSTPSAAPPTKAGPTATAAQTQLPTRTPAVTQAPVYEPSEFFHVCDPTILTPLIQVYVFDSGNRSVSGVEIIVTWDGGQDHFFTGLKPEFGLGYADYDMTPGVTYTVRLTDGGQPVAGLTPEECQATNGTLYFGSWRVSFKQP